MNLSKTELFRKSIHIASCFIPLLISWNLWVTDILLLLMLGLYLISESLRIKGKAIPVVTAVTKKASRNVEEPKIEWGPVFLVLGIIICSFMPLNCSTVGIFALAFGDGFASLIGKSFGKVKIPLTGGKTVAGSLACFTATFIALLFYTKNPVDALVFALLTAVMEMLPLGFLDNLIIPVGVAGLYWLSKYYFCPGFLFFWPYK